MYRRCLFCQEDLGANEVIAAFPVGRRLAYDAAMGRLWVVCPRCAQWNLTPLDARWEAIDEAERLYRGTRLRVTTDNVGLARLRDGAELVRIGRPLRPELAAWRWGDRFGLRRRRVLVSGGSALGAAAMTTGALAMAGLPLGVLGGLAAGGAYLAAIVAMTGGRARLFRQRWIPDGEGQHLLVTPNDLPSVRLSAGAGDGWALKVPFRDRRATTEPRWRDWINDFSNGEAELAGAAAVEASRRLLPLINGRGARDRHVRVAVALLEELGGAEAAFGRASRRVREWSARQTFGDSGALMHLPVEARLALEMAAHEEREREALDGELAALERAWRDAEAIAAIADELALPRGIQARLERLRGAG